MEQVELKEGEVELVREVLEEYLRELNLEILGTDTLSYGEVLRKIKKQTEISDLIDRFGRKAA